MTAAITPEPSGKIATIDGLRGWLALAVFAQHAAIYRDYLQTGLWRLPATHTFHLLGGFGVMVFFMITAYLFFGRAMRDAPNWPGLYIGRIFRIGPLYLLAFSLALVAAFLAGQLAPALDRPAFPGWLAAWIALGAGGNPQLSGVVGRLPLLGVTWSLQYEWWFYASLPVLALFRRWPTLLAVASFGAAIGLTMLGPSASPTIWAGAALFGVGAVVWTLPQARLPDWLSSCAAVALVAAAFVAPDSYTALPVATLGSAFYLIASGCTVFGLLTSRLSIGLGAISYGIYLLQGLIFEAVFAIPIARDLSLASEIGHWAMCAVACACLLAVAALAHVTVEQPGIEAGRRFAKYIAQRMSPSRAPAARASL